MLAETGDIPKILELIRTNPSIIHEEDDLKWTVLHEAIRSGRTELVELLIQHGANKDHLTKNGESPLHIARYFLRDNHAIVTYLESIGAIDIPKKRVNDEL
jgi:ankyrin repeat protein